jgi:hypothetical protein
LVDNEQQKLTSLDNSDDRSHVIRVAGPAALLVAKVIKVEERHGQPQRLQPKDGLDVLRLLQACETSPLGDQLATLAGDPLAGDVTRMAMSSLMGHGRDREGPLATLAARAVAGLAMLKPSSSRWSRSSMTFWSPTSKSADSHDLVLLASHLRW